VFSRCSFIYMHCALHNYLRYHTLSYHISVIIITFIILYHIIVIVYLVLSFFLSKEIFDRLHARSDLMISCSVFCCCSFSCFFHVHFILIDRLSNHLHPHHHIQDKDPSYHYQSRNIQAVHYYHHHHHHHHHHHQQDHLHHPLSRGS
jgi:hypothetical protein